VSGAVDTTGDEKPKLMIEEREDNSGYSLRSPGIMAAAIKEVADTLEIGVDDADWYGVDADDQVYKLDVTDEMLMQPSPQWRQLERSGDLNRDDLEKARQAYPDEQQRVITATWDELDLNETQELIESFGIDEAAPDLGQTLEQPHTFDLSKEYFSGLQQEPAMDMPFEETGMDTAPEM